MTNGTRHIEKVGWIHLLPYVTFYSSMVDFNSKKLFFTRTNGQNEHNKQIFSGFHFYVVRLSVQSSRTIGMQVCVCMKPVLGNHSTMNSPISFHLNIKSAKKRLKTDNFYLNMIQKKQTL